MINTTARGEVRTLGPLTPQSDALTTRPLRPINVLCSGVDAEYDQAISDIQSVEQALREYLDQQKKILGCRVNAYYLA